MAPGDGMSNGVAGWGEERGVCVCQMLTNKTVGTVRVATVIDPRTLGQHGCGHALGLPRARVREHAWEQMPGAGTYARNRGGRGPQARTDACSVRASHPDGIQTPISALSSICAQVWIDQCGRYIVM